MKNQVAFFDDIERLRGFACLIVLIQHIAWICPLRFIYSIIPHYLLLGEGGFVIFFAISGFVVTLSLREKLRELSGGIFLDRLNSALGLLSSFYKKRFFRIFPVAFLVFILAGIFFLISENDFKWATSFFRSPAELFCGSYNHSMQEFQTKEKIYEGALGPLWTLSVESIFYLLWPVTLLLCRDNNSRAILSLVAGCLFLLVIQPFADSFGEPRYYAFYGALPSLLLGSFFAFIYNEDIGKNFNKKTAMLITSVSAMYVWFYPNSLENPMYYGRMVIHISSIVLVVFSAFVRDSFNIPLLGRIFQYFGSRSYSFYAVQLVIASYTVFYTNSVYFPKDSLSEYDFFMYQLIIFFVILLIATEVVYRFVEKPFREFGRR